jgi:glycosyltransferase involved in cell wall biosynthesis
LTIGFSIIIPLYNKESYIQQTIHALAAQMCDTDEIIIVDDLSTDSGPFIARLFFETSSVRGHVVTLDKNSGPATARNFGVTISKNSFLLFFDADDIPLLNLLQTLRTVIDQNPSAVIFAYHIARQARGEKPTLKSEYSRTLTSLRPLHAFAMDSLVGKMLLHPSSTVVRRNVFLAADGGFQDGLRYCEDPELWVRLSSAYPIVEIHETLAVYRDVVGSLSYDLRGVVGSVNPYVETLTRLRTRYGDLYLKLARSIIFKNIFFSRASGVARLECLMQLNRYRDVVGWGLFIIINIAIMFPSKLFRLALDFRSAIAKTNQ